VDHSKVRLLEYRSIDLDSWIEQLVVSLNITNRYVKELVDLLPYSKFTPTCFRKWLPSSGGRRCLINYSSNGCVVGVYGLRFVQCGQLSQNGLLAYTDYVPSSVASCRRMGCWRIRITFRPVWPIVVELVVGVYGLRSVQCGQLS
jgi:hypothetical protein